MTAVTEWRVYIPTIGRWAECQSEEQGLTERDYWRASGHPDTRLESRTVTTTPWTDIA